MMHVRIDPENEFLYDIASLRFKFNEISSNTMQFMNNYYNHDCKELQKNFQLLLYAMIDCNNEVKLNINSERSPGSPLKKSTPKKCCSQSNDEEFFSASDSTPLPSRSCEYNLAHPRAKFSIHSFLFQIFANKLNLIQNSTFPVNTTWTLTRAKENRWADCLMVET